MGSRFPWTGAAMNTDIWRYWTDINSNGGMAPSSFRSWFHRVISWLQVLKLSTKMRAIRLHIPSIKLRISDTAGLEYDMSVSPQRQLASRLRILLPLAQPHGGQSSKISADMLRHGLDPFGTDISE